MNMSILYYLVWLLAFVAGVVLSFYAPETTLSVGVKFIFVGVWGSVLGFIFYIVARRAVQDNESEEVPTPNLRPITELVPVVASELAKSAAEETSTETPTPESAEAPTPAQAATAPESLLEPKELFPLADWDDFCKQILRNRPFSEVVGVLEKVMPKLFPGAAGVLYMYGDAQSEMHKVFSFGDYVISGDTMMPAECASFNLGEIVVNDYTADKVTAGCTHLHYHSQGVAFCAPIEGLEEHFGTLCVQVDKLPDGESIDFWKAKVSIVSATFGLYVANQNLNIRFQQHSIRDNLTGLFNKRYMEESLRREIFSASRHKTPIGIIMLYPDEIPMLQEKRGRHAVEQMLWEVGQRLPSYIRNEDIPCRYNGDVFCVILPGADYKITKDRAEKIRHEISQLQVAYGDGILKTTLSIGVSVMPIHAIDVQTLIATAEASMQMASVSGGNRVVLAEALNKQA